MDVGLSNPSDFTGVDAAAGTSAGQGRSGEARRAAAAFEAILLGAAFKPLAASLGFFGEALVDAVSRSVAERSDDALCARLTALFESR